MPAPRHQGHSKICFRCDTQHRGSTEQKPIEVCKAAVATGDGGNTYAKNGKEMPRGIYKRKLEVAEGDDDDLLRHLDVAYRREQWKMRQQKSRQCKNGKGFEVDHEVGSSLQRGVNVLTPLSSEDKFQCMVLLQEALGPEGLDECCCLVCDRLILRRDSVRKEGTDWEYVEKLRICLGEADPTLPEGLLDQYRAPPHIQGLEKVMVSPRGIHCYIDEENECPSAWMSDCKTCDASVKCQKLPKFSISNGFFLGRLPDYLRRLTIPERFMTQLTTVGAMTRVRGGRYRCIRSHCVALDSTPGPPVTLLSRSVADVASYRVVMVGDFTEGQVGQVKKMHRVRAQLVRDVFNFYKDFNNLYENMFPSDEVLNTDYPDDVVDEYLFDHVVDQDGNTRWVWIQSKKMYVVDRTRGMLYLKMKNTLYWRGAWDLPTIPLRSWQADIRSFLVLVPLKDLNGDLLARIFPHLFPFGRGHPGEFRQVQVSLKECVKHYISLSDRQFAEDELFALIAFDRISMQNMYIQNSIRCQRYPRLYDGYESIGVEQLGAALLENERRRQGCLPRKQQTDPVAASFLKTVELTSGSVWGSNSERSQCRRKAFAYQTRFGQPALFVTLTPNTDNSFATAHYAGVSSVKSLFDVLDARMPTKTELREGCLGNDCASARLFMRQIDAFIKIALGINPGTKQKMHYRGLFGDIRAYFGMVETQGRGTLHIHFLIWLDNFPANTAAIEALLTSSNENCFREAVQTYVSSIVTNDLPISTDSYSCSHCGASFSSVMQLPIPQAARRDPKAGLPNQHARQRVTEPSLLCSETCRATFSSQHVLRSLLLQSRPLYWPVWPSTLSPEEIEEQASSEVACRNSKKHAVRAVEEREQMQWSIKGESDLRNESGLTALETKEWLEHANCFQMEICKSDDDPFQNDYLTRLIEMLPPSKLNNRMPKEAMDYMVSTLVLLLNQHWWCHTSICFKQSRATLDASCCRYQFPRDRVAQTVFTSAGVELCRHAAHEFINGYNYVLMATFKCNHDIQVLLGGSDASDRIYYCCKYVTKHQKRLDSSVAVALAALKRRQEQEAQEVSVSALDEEINFSFARKRVASVAYAMTNGQEIAGPLAALYLYRGSCCYSSVECTSLPLGDVVQQLRSVQEYSCYLVNNSAPVGESSYRAVSFLDDYIYRPEVLKATNLYEFSMRFFRKRDSHALKSRLPFLAQHPLCTSHSVGKRYIEVVPVIYGYRVPYVREGSPLETKSKRALLSLVLFKPFRDLSDLIGGQPPTDEAWLNTYEAWVNHRSEFVRTIMDNMDDYYCGASHAKSERHPAVNTGVEPHMGRDQGEEESEDDDNVALFDELFTMNNDDYQDQDEINGRYVDVWDGEAHTNGVLETSSLNPSICPTAARPDACIGHMICAFTDLDLLKDAAAQTTTTSSCSTTLDSFPTITQMQEWIADSGTDNAVVAVAAPATVVRDTKVIEMVEDALIELNMTWEPQNQLAHTPPAVPEFATISSISQAFTLNKKQHFALKAIGKALLTRWKNSESLSYLEGDLSSKLNEDQLLFFLGGEGGTGKSRIIDAVEKLCSSWGRADCLIKTALTGKAATLRGGRTLASFLLQLRRLNCVEAAVNLSMVVIDEVSMMKKSQLVELDKLLRIAKHVPDVAFGGVNIVLAGDFLQLPPIGADPLYRDPAGKLKCRVNEIAGYQLWRSFHAAIVLDECVRFQQPEWGNGCRQARCGIWTPKFVGMINSRVLKVGTALRSVSFGDNASTPTFVTPDNSTRLAINNMYISRAAKFLPSHEYPVRIVADFKGKLASLSRAEKQMVMAFPDSKFGRMAPYLDLIVGMPIQVTQNIRPAKMVANGTLGTLDSIIYEPGTEFRVVRDSVAGILVKIPSLPPRAVLVRISRGNTAFPMLGCSSPDLFPLLFKSQAYNQCMIPLAGISHGKPRALTVKIQQFPLVCALASTVYKVQGETLTNMVVTEWRSKTTFANKREQPYLLVSRVTSRWAFTTLSPLTPDIIEWAHPPSDALAEEERLVQLSMKTMSSLR